MFDNKVKGPDEVIMRAKKDALERDKIKTELSQYLKLDQEKRLNFLAKYLRFMNFEWFDYNVIDYLVFLKFKATKSYVPDLPDVGTMINEEELRPEVVYLLSQRFMKRMRFLKQLCFVPYLNYISGSHSREEHTWGVVYWAHVIFDRLSRFIANNDKNLSKIELWKKIAVILYAALHDSTTGPFGHTLEAISEEITNVLFFPKAQERTDHYKKLDKKLLSEYMKEPEKHKKGSTDHFTNEIIRQIVIQGGFMDPKKIDEFFSFLGCLMNKEQMALNHPKDFYLAEIVNSHIDADRIDFLNRDLAHIEFNKEIHNLSLKLVNSIQIREVDTKISEEQPNVKLNRLAFPENLREDARDFLIKRQKCYSKYYEADRPHMNEHVLCHLIFEFFRANHLFILNNDNNPDIIDLKKEAIKRFMNLTDMQLVQVFKDIYNPPYCYDMLVKMLTEQISFIMAGSPLCPLTIDFFENENSFGNVVDELGDYLDKSTTELQQRLKNENDSIRNISEAFKYIGKNIREDLDTITDTIANFKKNNEEMEKKWKISDILLYYFILDMDTFAGFPNLVKTDKLFWAAISRSEKYKEEIRSFFSFEFSGYKTRDQELVMRFPHTFISIPYYLGRKELEQKTFIERTEILRRLLLAEREYERFPLVFYDSINKRNTNLTPEEIPTLKSIKHFSVRLFITDVNLTSDLSKSIREDFRKAFEDFIEKGTFKTQVYQNYIREEEKIPDQLVKEIQKSFE